MGARAAVVEDRYLLPDVGVALVVHAVRVLLVREPDLGVRPVTERLERRGPAAAERHLRQRRQRHAQPAHEPLGVGHEVWTVVGGPDRARELGLDRPQLGQPTSGGLRVGGKRKAVGEILQRRGRFQQLVGSPGLRPQHGGFPRQLPQTVSRRTRRFPVVTARGCPCPLGAPLGARLGHGRGPLQRPNHRPTQARRRVPKQIPIRFRLACHPACEVAGKRPHGDHDLLETARDRTAVSPHGDRPPLRLLVDPGHAAPAAPWRTCGSRSDGRSRSDCTSISVSPLLRD